MKTQPRPGLEHSSGSPVPVPAKSASRSFPSIKSTNKRPKWLSRCIAASLLPQCGQNERYNSGCATPCPGTCNKPVVTTCPAVCRPGCECSPGLLRNEDWECVEPSRCAGAGHVLSGWFVTILRLMNSHFRRSWILVSMVPTTLRCLPKR